MSDRDGRDGSRDGGAAVALEVQRFGQRERVLVPPEETLTFPHGLVGMPDLRRFALLEDARIAPCRWLQSLDQPEAAFAVVDPHLVAAAYRATVPADDVQALDVAAPGDAELWTILTIAEDAARSSANLLAPVAINRRRRLGQQLVLEGSGYALRHPLTPMTPIENGPGGGSAPGEANSARPES